VNLVAFHAAERALPYAAAFALAFFVAAASNFTLNRSFTFAHARGGDPLPQLARFLAVSGATLLLDLALLAALVESAGLPRLVAAAAAIALVTPASFLANRSWSFGRPQPSG
jgi:putative flippase GtrA